MAIVVNIDNLYGALSLHRDATDSLMAALARQSKARRELDVDTLTDEEKSVLLNIAQKKLDKMNVSKYAQTDAEARRIFANPDPEPDPVDPNEQ